ncbi:MAG: hypothetical protein KY467_16030 [Gemmatimonadetes bacterium]|nr:hypothetical protein [Gemmatimonadota bacterium]
MADINIERKRRSPLPWIIGLLVLALLAFLLMRSCGDDEVATDDAAVMADTTTAGTPVPTQTVTP